MGTEKVLVIPDNAGSTTFATVILILAIAFVAYELITIAWQLSRYRKLKKKSEEIENKKSEEEFLNKYAK